MSPEMTGQVALGWVLIVLGLLFVLVGFAGAIQNIFRSKETTTRSMTAEAMTAFLKALTELIKALSTAPLWLVCVLLGFALIAYGSRLAFPPASPVKSASLILVQRRGAGPPHAVMIDHARSRNVSINHGR